VGWAIDRAHSSHINTPLELSDYRAGIIILAGFTLMGLVATLFIRETYCRYADSGQVD
jgi:polyferredoxin